MPGRKSRRIAELERANAALADELCWARERVKQWQGLYERSQAKPKLRKRGW